MLDIQLEAQNMQKNCEVIESSNLIRNNKRDFKKKNKKKIIFDPNDFSYATYTKFNRKFKTQFIPKPNFQNKKELSKQIKK